MPPFFEVTAGVYDIEAYLKSIGVAFDHSPKKLALATSRSINRSLVTVRKAVDQGIRKKYYVKSADVKKSLRMTKANSGKLLNGALHYESEKALPLSQFGAKQGKNYVSVRILKENRRRRIQPGGGKDIISTQKGRAAVWMAKGKKGGMQVFARTGNPENKEQQQVIVLYGASFMSFFNEDGINARLHEIRRESMRKNLLHEVEAIKKGFVKVGK